MLRRISHRLGVGASSYLAGLSWALFYWIGASILIVATHVHNDEYFDHYAWANIAFNVGNVLAFAAAPLHFTFQTDDEDAPSLYGVLIASLIFAIPIFGSGTVPFLIRLAIVSPLCILALAAPRVIKAKPSFWEGVAASSLWSIGVVLAVLSVALWVAPTPPVISGPSHSAGSADSERPNFYNAPPGGGEAGENCSPDYDPCVPDVDYDLDCADVGEQVSVVGTDVYGLDRDGDGAGCESW